MSEDGTWWNVGSSFLKAVSVYTLLEIVAASYVRSSGGPHRWHWQEYVSACMLRVLFSPTLPLPSSWTCLQLDAAAWLRTHTYRYKLRYVGKDTVIEDDEDEEEDETCPTLVPIGK